MAKTSNFKSHRVTDPLLSDSMSDGDQLLRLGQRDSCHLTGHEVELEGRSRFCLVISRTCWTLRIHGVLCIEICCSRIC